MKKLILLLSFLLISASVQAEVLKLGELVQKLPPLKQGIAYDVATGDFNYLSTIELAKYKGFNLEVGYSADDKAVGVISYQLLKLKDIGVTLPILDLVEFNLGFYGGYSRIQLNEGMGQGNNEFSYGPSLTLLNVKW